jgi:hypothetical protein
MALSIGASCMHADLQDSRELSRTRCRNKMTGEMAGTNNHLLLLLCPVRAGRDKRQAQQKQGRRDRKENDAKIKIGIDGEMTEDFGYPIADHHHAGGGGDGVGSKADGVVAENSAGRIQLSRNISNNDTFPPTPVFDGPLEESGPAFNLRRL